MSWFDGVIDSIFGGGGEDYNPSVGDILRGQEDQRVNQVKSEMDAYNKYLSDYNAAKAAAGGGGGDGGKSAEEAARQAAMQAAKARVSQGYKGANKQFRPFAQAAKQLLPQMQQAYGQGLGLANTAMGSIGTQANMNLLNTPTSRSQMAPIQLPKNLQGGR